MIEKEITYMYNTLTTLVWHVDKISTKYTHIIMDTFIILLYIYMCDVPSIQVMYFCIPETCISNRY